MSTAEVLFPRCFEKGKCVKIIFHIFCLLAGLTLCGCIYDVPLVEKATIPVDPALTGMWQFIPEGGEEVDPDEKMQVLPFSANEYVVIYPSEKDDMHFRAYPIQLDDLLLVQLEWLEAASKMEDRYHVCRYTLDDGILTVETLNNSVVESGITDSKALCETLLANRDNPDLFEDSGRYRKLKE